MNKMIERSKKNFKSKKGFTLIELIVVIVIIGILAAIVIPRLSGFSDTANEKSALASATTIKTAAAAVYAQTGTTPTEDQIIALVDSDEVTTTSLAYTGTGSAIVFTFNNGSHTANCTTGGIGVTKN